MFTTPSVPYVAIYWFLSQKVSLISTLRRLGEELYRPRQVRFNESDQDLTKPVNPTTGSQRSSEHIKTCAHFLRSNDLHIRVLSALIILKTLTQGKLRAASISIQNKLGILLWAIVLACVMAQTDFRLTFLVCLNFMSRYCDELHLFAQSVHPLYNDCYVTIPNAWLV